MSQTSEYQALFIADRAKPFQHALPPAHMVAQQGQDSSCCDGNEQTPLSFAQQRLWFIHKLQNGTCAYNRPLILRCAGYIQRAALEQSINTIIQRHAILRTTFHEIDGQPIQVIAPFLHLPLVTKELNNPSVQERENQAWEIARQEVQRPFDLTQGPLIRGLLLQLTAQEHVLILVLHHIVTDGWSINILLQELSTCYRAYAVGDAPVLTPLPLQYAEYARRERETFSAGAQKEAQLYWKQQLADVPELLELPTDHPRPAESSFQGARVAMRFSLAHLRELQTLARRERSTLYMVLLASFQILLMRYTHQEDIVVGSPIAHRNTTDIEGLIGCFPNMLVLRTKTQGKLTFRQILAQVRKNALQAYEYQDYPLEKIVEMVSPERSLHTNPLFQVVFALQKRSTVPYELPGVTMQRIDIDPGIAMFDLLLDLAESAEGLVGWFEYNTDIFDESTIQRLARHFQTVVEGILRNPDAPVADLLLLSEGELQQILRLQVNPYEKRSPVACLNTLFEQQAGQQPEAIAVTCGQESMSYQQLDQRANQLAHYLHSLGVGPEVRVGLYLERSIDMVVALLGILKAGGAYVPIDFSYPQDRLAFMLDNSQASMLITQCSLLDRVSALSIPTVCLDRDAHLLAVQPAWQPECLAQAENAAYIIYTSGSTGKPKGVLVTHANVCQLFAATQASYAFTAKDVWTLFHSIAFDFSVWELWGALLYGGRLLVVPYWVSRSPEAFYDLLIEEKVTVLNQTPSAFRQLQLVDGQRASAALRVRLVIFGGEALDLASLKPWYERHGDAIQLVNMYGITETTVHVTARPLCAADIATTGSSLIGHPLPAWHVYLLDKHLHPVPIGVTGEIYVGGAGISRGYVEQSALTAERFIPNPFDTHGGQRLYKTGDLARWLPNGDLEYMGRIDKQVKIRGFRIELGEITAALHKHPAVRECVVIAREDHPGDKQLIAYVVTQQTIEHINVLRDFLAESLPQYMLPAHFVIIEAFPLTTNGKINVQALPAPNHHRPELQAAFVPPRTAVEQRLAALWSQILGVEQVGIYDNFFDLGGDSLLCSRFVAQAKEQELRISLRDAFKYPTISQLVRALAFDEQQDVEQEIHSTPFQLLTPQDRAMLAEDIEDAYPLTLLQMGMLFHESYEARDAVYHNITKCCVRAPCDYAKLAEAIQQLATRHPLLRTSFDLSTYSRPLQLVHKQAHIPVHLNDVRALSGQEQERLLADWLARETSRKFDWTSAPLLRFSIFQVQDEVCWLVFTEHHAILDGWSVASMLTELLQTYARLLQQDEQENVNQPLPLFRDYVQLEQHILNSAEQQQYWMKKIATSTPTILQPCRDQALQKAGQTAKKLADFNLPLSATEQLKTLARQLNVPLKSIFLAAHLRVLSCISGEEQVLTGVVAGCRPEQLHAEKALGVFLNTTPFSGKVSNGTWADLIQQTLASEQEMLPFRRYPLAEIQRQAGRQALFNTLFNFVHFHVQQQLQDLKHIELLEVQTMASTNFVLATDVVMHPTTAQLRIRLQYDTGYFDEQIIQSIGGYYLQALEDMVNDPFAQYTSRSLLSIQERHKLLTAWNSGDVCYPQDILVHHLIEQQALTAPQSIAVRCGEQELTYQALNERANALASALQSVGIGPEKRVGIYLERSTDVIIALLAVLKAGGAYVPLDPAYPHERLTFMVADAHVAAILTSETYTASMPALPSACRCLLLEHMLGDSAISEIPSVLTPAKPENLAYIIYTSGSTGQPKGVMITHQSLVNAYHAWNDAYQLQANVHNHLQMASFSFDVFTGDVVRALCSGATLVLCPRETLFSAEQLYALIQSEHIDCAEFVPAVLRNVLSYLADHKQMLTSLRVLVVGSDVWTWDDYAHVRALCQPDTRIINSFGVTEATVDSSFYECPSFSARTNVGAESIPIGHPFANTQLYILDRYMQPVPPHVTGTLYIGGRGLARGYYRRPALTAERFVPHPWSLQAGDRLYNTGDFARYRSDGTIAFLGRADRQVKLRGYRIELAEIEHVLCSHPDVSEAVAIIREDIPGDQRLTAYAVTSTSEKELFSFVRQHLPAAMIPSHLVTLDALPLTPNGKRDWQALPAPIINEEPASKSEEKPSTPTEELLLQIWQHVFQRAHVLPQSHFFDLGGHSLLAMQLLSRIHRAFSIDVPFRALFEAPTVQQLARVIDQYLSHSDSLSDSEAVLSESYHERNVVALPLSYAQQRLWFLAQLEPSTSSYHMPEALWLNGALDIAALQLSLQQLQQRHEILRTSLPLREGSPIQQIHPVGALPLPVTDLTHLSASEREQVALQHAQQFVLCPFDLQAGPLWRACLLRLSSERHLLVLCLHHSICDGWSLDLLFDELSGLYRAVQEGLPCQLEPLPLQYADYTLWQRAHLQSARVRELQGFWQRQLAGASFLAELPITHQLLSPSEQRAATHSFWVSAALLHQLQQLAQQAHVTLYMLLLASFEILLARWSGQKDLLIGTALSQRPHPAFEKVLGLFVNPLPIRSDLAGNPSSWQLLQRVRQRVLEVHAHQELPFEQLVELVQPPRQVGVHPLFQVAFLFQTAWQDHNQQGGLRWEPFELELPSHKLDLTLAVNLQEEGLQANLKYARELFEPTNMAQLAEQWVTLLESIVEKPHRAISRLSLLKAEQRQALLRASRAPILPNAAQSLTGWQSVISCFEQQVERYPDHLALSDGVQTWTYRQLNETVNRVARLLQHWGVGPEVRVGLQLPRSGQCLLLALAVLKAGGAYVPLDPSYPAERLAFMQADARLSLLVREGQASASVNACCQQRSLDEVWEHASEQATANLASNLHPEQLAYLIYTSGSTGKPKGVLVAHRGLSNVAAAQRAGLAVGPGDRIGQCASLNFDASVFEWIMALLQGASLHMNINPEQRAGEGLWCFLQEQAITTAVLPPSLVESVSAQVESGYEPDKALPHLRTLLLAGEAPSAQQVASWGRGRKVYNAYGPTETTIWATLEECPRDERTPALGQPISQMEAYVLDEALELVPSGTVGELYLGGIGLARGYEGRPALTAERFVPHPFSEQAGARLYRTGDLARRRADGKLEFAGRCDRQVKLRGYRVELGEIERVLEMHPAVRQAIVTLYSTPHEQPFLVAYLLPFENGAGFSVESVRHFAKEHLPGYMLPISWVQLERVPLTVNDKIDYHKLPAPTSRLSDQPVQMCLAQTDLEQTLARVWQAALHLEAVDIDSNFFELGGHSLLLIHVCNHLQTCLGDAVSMLDLFTYPTIRSLAGYLGEKRATLQGLEQVTARAKHKKAALHRFNREHREKR